MAVSATTRRGAQCACLVPLLGCATVDPGPNFVVSDVTFDPDYFYCHVEPQFIFANHCGPGDPATDPPNGCHFTSAAVSGMVLLDHPAVNCGGGDHPVDLTQIGTGSAAQGNLVAVSAEMNQDYVNAPLLIRPSGHSHKVVIDAQDPTVVMLLSTWAK